MGAAGRKLRVEIEFGGIVNGVPVTITGRGHVGQGRLNAELHADVVPLGFDPALPALGSLDVILAVTVGTGAAGDAVLVEEPADGARPDPLFAHTDLVLLDDTHRELGRVGTVLRVETAPGWVEVRGQLTEARTNMEAMERVTSVERICVGPPVPLGRDGAVLTRTVAFETSFGHEYLSVAVSRLTGVGGWPKSLCRSLVGAEVRDLALERAGGRERDCRVMVGVDLRCPRE